MNAKKVPGNSKQNVNKFVVDLQNENDPIILKDVTLEIDSLEVNNDSNNVSNKKDEIETLDTSSSLDQGNNQNSSNINQENSNNERIDETNKPQDTQTKQDTTQNSAMPDNQNVQEKPNDNKGNGQNTSGNDLLGENGQSQESAGEKDRQVPNNEATKDTAKNNDDKVNPEKKEDEDKQKNFEDKPDEKKDDNNQQNKEEGKDNNSSENNKANPNGEKQDGSSDKQDNNGEQSNNNQEKQSDNVNQNNDSDNENKSNDSSNNNKGEDNKDESKSNNGDKQENKSSDKGIDEQKKKDQLNRATDDNDKKNSKLKEKIQAAKDKKENIQNKVNQAKDKVNKATHPLENAKNKAKEKINKKKEEVKDKLKNKLKKMLLNLIKTHPLIVIIVIAAVFVIFALIVIMIAFTESTDPKYNVYSWSEYNYENVEVIVGEETISLQYYCLGATYTKFYVEGYADEFDNDAELENAMKTYYLYVKSSVLDQGYDSVSQEKTLQGSNTVGETPAYCNPFYGCNVENGTYVSANSNDDNIEGEVEPTYKGIDDIKIKSSSGSEVYFESLFDDLDNKIITSTTYSDVLVQSKDQIEVTNISDNVLREIIDLSKDGKSYEEVIEKIEKDNGRDAVIYDVEEVIEEAQMVNTSATTINSSFKFVDQGFYWPIGNGCKSVDGVTICDGAPGYTGISSQYGGRGTKYRGAEWHNGIDIPTGGSLSVPVIAISDGQVVSAYCSTTYWQCGYDKKGNDPYYGGGCQIKIYHGNNIYSNYLHLQNVNSVKVGQTVVRGQKIGMVGTTGCSTGEHLHFSIFLNGTDVNPLNYVSQTKTR